MEMLEHHLTPQQLTAALERFMVEHAARFADYSPSAGWRTDGVLEVSIRLRGMLVFGLIRVKSASQLALTAVLPRPLEPYFLTRSETMFAETLRACLDAEASS